MAAFEARAEMRRRRGRKDSAGNQRGPTLPNQILFVETWSHFSYMTCCLGCVQIRFAFILMDT